MSFEEGRPERGDTIDLFHMQLVVRIPKGDADLYSDDELAGFAERCESEAAKAVSALRDELTAVDVDPELEVRAWTG